MMPEAMMAHDCWRRRRRPAAAGVVAAVGMHPAAVALQGAPDGQLDGALGCPELVHGGHALCMHAQRQSKDCARRNRGRWLLVLMWRTPGVVLLLVVTPAARVGRCLLLMRLWERQRLLLLVGRGWRRIPRRLRRQSAAGGTNGKGSVDGPGLEFLHPTFLQAKIGHDFVKSGRGQ